MCTVTFLPTKEGFIVTTNRDESAQRTQAEPPQVRNEEPLAIYPLDPEGGGTWVAAAKNRVVCLMNGAHGRHKRKPPYRHSRGKIVVDAIKSTDLEEFINNYPLHEIEPFTLILAQNEEVIQLAWNGKRREIQKLSSENPYIWSAPMLYSAEAQRKRKSWFAQWLEQNPTFNSSEIIDFHMNAGERDSAIDLRMNRGDKGPQTVCITCIKWTPDRLEIEYRDLLSNSIKKLKWP
jgi:uncharacterized protein with NRDE domain